MFDYLSEYKKWQNSNLVPEEMKQEISNLDEEEKKSRFYTLLNFGTAGLRGILGAGLNRMNIFTVRHATQAVSSLILEEGQAACLRGVVVACDSRIMSTEFSREVCKVFAANGIKSYLFDELRPTAELSYAVRKLNCIAGVNITASHNPKEYNGYKLYWQDGAQITPEQAKAVFSRMKETDVFDDVKIINDDELSKYITTLTKDFDEKYLSEILKQSINPDVIKKQSDIKIVYTPIHGSGYRLVPEILSMAGFKNICLVKEQMQPDGNFPTVKSPNPENKESFNLAMELAGKECCDLIIGTDPDTDRIGVVAPDENCNYSVLTGNQTGAILLEYIISAKRAKGTLPDNACAIKTVVTSELGTSICNKNNIKMMNVLTGFKFIGEKMEEFDKNKDYTFIFGYEESYGCLAGTHARDKDAVVAALLICEAAAYYKEQGMTLLDALYSIYAKYGFYSEKVINIEITGAYASEKMAELMRNLRSNPILKVGNACVSEVIDYEKGIDDLPKSNMLYYKLDDGSNFVIRPSGTEPKVKIYVMTLADNCADSKEKAETYANEIEEIFNVKNKV